jgi:hypothetical protein
VRGLVRGGKDDRAAAGELIADLAILPAERWHTSSFLPRIWELRGNLTLNDAAAGKRQLTEHALPGGPAQLAAELPCG